MIIGISGYARSGKDTLGQHMVSRHGFKRVAFADKVREGLYALNPYIDSSALRVQDVVDLYGWDKIKRLGRLGDEVRGLLQRFGTEFGREILGENVWVNAALKDYNPADRLVVTDVRFQNEVDAIRERHGFVVDVQRPGVGPVNSHASDTKDFEPDFVITNNGTIEELGRKFDHLWNSPVLLSVPGTRRPYATL